MPFIQTQPIESLLGAYQPIQFGVGILDSFTSKIPPQLEAQIFVNGTLQGVPYLLNPKGTNAGTGGITYSFEFDASAGAQRFFDSQIFFPALGSNTIQANTNFQGDLVVRFYEWTDNGLGRLQRNNTFVETQVIVTLNAYTTIQDIQNFRQYNAGLGNQNNSILQLTSKPLKTLVALDDSEYVGLMSRAIMATQYLFYGAAGQVGRGNLVHTPDMLNNDRAIMVPVGPANINNITTWDATSTGTQTVDSSIDFYTVRHGLICTDGSLLSYYAPRIYFPRENPWKAYRFHFINRFGLVDSFTINNLKGESVQTQSNLFVRPLPQVITSTVPSKITLQKSRVKSFNCVATNLTQGQVAFLEEFVSSPWVQIEVDGQQFKVVIDDGDYSTTPQDRGLSTFRFTGSYSVDTFAQRN